MRSLSLVVAGYATVLFVFNEMLTVNAFIIHLPSLSFRGNTAKSASTDMTAAINTVMRSTPPIHIPSQSVIQHTSLLVSLWDKIAFPNEDDEDTDFKLSDYGMTRADVGGFITHFQTCKDCAADHAFLMATQDDSGEDVLRLNNVYFPVLTEADSDDEW